jgi:hypothetical protein
MTFDVGQLVWITGTNWPVPERTTVDTVNKRTCRVASRPGLLFHLDSGYETTAGGRACRIETKEPK